MPIGRRPSLGALAATAAVGTFDRFAARAAAPLRFQAAWVNDVDKRCKMG